MGSDGNNRTFSRPPAANVGVAARKEGLLSKAKRSQLTQRRIPNCVFIRCKHERLKYTARFIKSTRCTATATLLVRRVITVSRAASPAGSGPGTVSSRPRKFTMGMTACALARERHCKSFRLGKLGSERGGSRRQGCCAGSRPERLALLRMQGCAKRRHRNNEATP